MKTKKCFRGVSPDLRWQERVRDIAVYEDNASYRRLRDEDKKLVREAAEAFDRFIAERKKDVRWSSATPERD